MPPRFCDPDPQPFPSAALSTTEHKVHTLLERGADTGWEPTGLTRATYLDLAERIVRAAAGWQDEHGAIIDPVAREELGQTSPRFVSSAAVLLSQGRIGDLAELVFRGMDWCCGRLARGEAKSPDFWTRELMMAWWALESVEVPEARRAGWRTHLTALDPERTYLYVESAERPIETLHNWVVYAAAGEAMRDLAGLVPPSPEGPEIAGARFWEKYMPHQLAHFSEHGMYRDPGDPMTYDMTTRLQMATPLFYGLETAVRPQLEDLLRRGGLVQLLYVAPNGLAPFGGRSSSIQIQEAILAALGELEARRYRGTNPALAGAFKRQARLGIASIRRWLDASPHRHIKNMYSPGAMHGCEPYAGYAVYSLYTASCLVLAAQFADEEIAEAVTPAEIGGYVLELAPAFHKIIATCGGTQIEIDTRADPKYDATGLGRILHAGAPMELALALPFTPEANYTLPEELRPSRQLAIGPRWQNAAGEWQSLAEHGESFSVVLTVHEESAEEVAFDLTWLSPALEREIREQYRLRSGRLIYEVNVGEGPLQITAPLLQTDGEVAAEMQLAETAQNGVARVRYRGGLYTIRWQGGSMLPGGLLVGNRNGVYLDFAVEFPGGSGRVEFCIASPA